MGGQPAISATCGLGLVVDGLMTESHCSAEQVLSPLGRQSKSSGSPSSESGSDVLPGTMREAVRPQPLGTPSPAGTLMHKISRHQPKAEDNQMLNGAWHKEEGVEFLRKGTVSG